MTTLHLHPAFWDAVRARLNAAPERPAIEREIAASFEAFRASHGPMPTTSLEEARAYANAMLASLDENPKLRATVQQQTERHV